MTYHWVWYLLGLLMFPRITLMIFLHFHCLYVPVWFTIIGWMWAIGNDIIFRQFPQIDKERK